MDTSRQYIDMCIKAEEIQKRWGVLPGDYVWDRIDLVFPLSHNNITYIFKDPRLLDMIFWLPRQDQLQDIISENWQVVWGDFHLWIQDYDVPGTTRVDVLGLTSMEQVWLTFVMYELYKKEWRTGEWKGIQ